MGGFRPDKIVFGVLCVLAGFSALISGSMYHFSGLLFGAAVILCFFILMAGESYRALAAVWPAWLFSSVVWSSCIWSLSLNASATQGFYFTIFAAFSFLAACSGGGQRAERLLQVMVWTSAAVSLYGIYQYSAGFSRTVEYVQAYGASEFGMSEQGLRKAIGILDYRRAFSTMLSPNMLACYIAAVFPAGVHLATAARGQALRALYVMILVTLFTALVMTKSIGGIAAFVAGIAVYAASVSAGAHKYRRMIMAAIAVLAILTVISGAFVMSKRSGGFMGFERSYAERLSYFGGALKAFSAAPIVGNGAGSFSLTYFADIKPGGDETRFAHNLPLQTLAETGLAGLAALIVLFGVYFARCIKGLRRDGGAGVYPALLAGGAAFLAHNMVDFSFYVHETSAVFWLYFGMAASQEAPSQPGRTTLVKRYAKLSAIAAALLVCLYYAKAEMAWSAKEGALSALRAYGLNNSNAVRSNPSPEEALNLASKAVSLKPYDDSLWAMQAYMQEGTAYAKGAEFAEMAEESYNKAISLNPAYPFHYRDLGILYLKMGRTDDAVSCFRKAVRLYPANKDLARLLSETEK